MNVLQINKYFYRKGGAETVFFNTIDLLKERGIRVNCFCLKSVKNNPSEDSCYFVDYPELSEVGRWKKLKNTIAFFYNRESKKKIEKLILDKKPDVAHIHLLFNGISVSILPVLKKYHIPIVMTVHDYRLICPAYTLLNGNGKTCEKCQKGNYFHCIVNNCSRKGFFVNLMLTFEMYFRNIFYSPIKYVNKFIFVSQFTLEKHASFNTKYKNKGVLLYNFTKQETGVAIEKKASDRYFLYYGRLSYEKGIFTLLKAIKGLNINLKIVGDGPLLKEMMDQQSGIEPNIELLGYKSGAALWEIIRNAYFVIAPSEWYETFGLTVIEPQIEGIPVIGAKIGAIPELINDGENGFLFEAGNAIELRQIIEKTLAFSAEQYEAMSLSAKAQGKQFTNSEIVCEKLMNLYL